MNPIEQLNQFLTANNWLLPILGIWSIIWKGLALWKASQKKEKIWFVILLVLNTLGIAEILYYFVFSKIEKLSLSKKG